MRLRRALVLLWSHCARYNHCSSYTAHRHLSPRIRSAFQPPQRRVRLPGWADPRAPPRGAPADARSPRVPSTSCVHTPVSGARAAGGRVPSISCRHTRSWGPLRGWRGSPVRWRRASPAIRVRSPRGAGWGEAHPNPELAALSECPEEGERGRVERARRGCVEGYFGYPAERWCIWRMSEGARRAVRSVAVCGTEEGA